MFVGCRLASGSFATKALRRELQEWRRPRLKDGRVQPLQRENQARPRGQAAATARRDAAGARRHVPRPSRVRGEAPDDPDAAGQALAAAGRVRRRRPLRVRGHDGRGRRLRLTSPRPVPLRGRVGAPSDLRGRRPLRVHDAEPGQARRQEPAACTTRRPGVTPSTS